MFTGGEFNEPVRSSELTTVVMVVTIDDSFPGGTTHLGLFEALDVYVSSGRFEDEDEAVVGGDDDDDDESLSGSDESFVDALTKRMRS